MSTHYDDEDDYLVRLWALRRLLTSHNPSVIYIQHIARSTSLAEFLADSALRTYVPAFKAGMSTSILSGDLWIQQCLQHENHRYMTETFGMNANTFTTLCAELNLEDGRSVCKELQLAIFILIARGKLHLRLLGDRVQKAKDTASKYFKVVLSRLIDPTGFYAKYVHMPDVNPTTPRYISRDPRFSGYFDNCIGAVDGTHIPML